MKKLPAAIIVLIFGITILSQPTDICYAGEAYSSGDYPFGPSDEVIVDALEYLSNQQTTEGSIGGFSTSAWAAMAIAADGENPHEWGNLVEYLQNNVDMLDPDKATDWERQTLAIVACNENPRDFGGIDYVEKIESFYDGNQIGSASNLYDDFFGILALISAGMDKEALIIQNVITYIKDQQDSDGGWGDVDSTAVAVMALIAAGEDHESETIQDALCFMKGLQTEDGGFQSWGTTNAASTSWAVDAIVATGEDPTSNEWENNGNNPVDYLVSLQQENGCFNWTINQNLSPEWMTSYVIPALLGVPYPVKIYTSDDEWTGTIRIEGENETIWNGEITVGSSYITAENASSGEMETYYISYPSVLGALDEASKQGGFSYFVIYYLSWDAFYVQSIAGESDWWQYWVDYELPMVGCGAYELTENDNEILWGYVEDWYPHALRIDVDKHDVNRSEEFTVSVYNETMAPVEDAVVYVDSLVYMTNEDGKVTVHIDAVGAYEIYSEKERYVRSEKVTVNVKIKKIVEIVKPENGAIYIMNKKLRIRIQKILIIGSIDIEVKITDDVEKVEFYIDNELKYVDTEQPFMWRWDERAFFKKTIKVKAYVGDESYDSDEKEVCIFHL